MVRTSLMREMTKRAELEERAMLTDFLDLCEAFHTRPILLTTANYIGTVSCPDDITKTHLTWCAVYRYAIEDAKLRTEARVDSTRVLTITSAFDRLLDELYIYEEMWV